MKKKKLVARLGNDFLLEQEESYEPLDPDEIAFIELLPKKTKRGFGKVGNANGR